MSHKRYLGILLATTTLATPATAQTGTQPGANPPPADEIVVTAQKREENLQAVPISIQALGTRKLDQLNVSTFNDYARLLPSVTFQTSAPGSTNVYMRGVASGGDGNHSGPLPSVGVYLDEQPVTTIGGALDVHIYDIARIESLAGPQGTLYGASSQAGTIRIITNKPSTAGFEGRVDGEVNLVEHGGVGGKLEGMINTPLSDRAALRVVGWYQRNAGYIDAVPGTRQFIDGATVTNPQFVKKDYNPVDIYGGRAALQIDLDDNWTVTPTVIAQEQRTKGRFGFDPKVGDLKVQAFYPESSYDRFVQAALTIQGKLSNWDLTYAGAYLDRVAASQTDYTDYAEQYDQLYAGAGGLAGYFYIEDAAGNDIDPRQRIIGRSHFTKLSQELRVASPASEPLRVVAGLFYQRQTHAIHQDYVIPGLAPALSVNGHPGTLWLTEQDRVDRDYAMFGEISYDIVPTLTVTAGGRAFIYDNSLIGFFGFGRNPNGPPYNGAGSSRTGVAGCYTADGATVRDGTGAALLPSVVRDGPCTNLATFANGRLLPKRATGQGFTHRLNITWKPSDTLMLYGTWSRGFRPGGINRRSTVPPYGADYLTNYELGFKTSFLDRRIRLNAAIYQQEWKAFQFAFLGANSFTQVQNGPDARIRGIEGDVSINAAEGLTVAASAAFTDAKTRAKLCSTNVTNCTGNDLVSDIGTRLPITPQFKGSAQVRYQWPMGDARPFIQALVAHQSSATSDIRNLIFLPGTGDPVNPAEGTGRLAAYTTADFRAGIEWQRFSVEAYVQNAFDERGQLARNQQCGVCFQRVYIVPVQPRTFGLRVGTKF